MASPLAGPPRPAASPLRLTAAVRAAAEEGRPVVVLESSVLAQGLPVPANREAAERMCGAVERAGAVPAVTAVVRGCATLGLEPDELARFLARDGVRKVSARDLAAAMLRGADGATTVAASLALGRAAGFSVFATGGIGGVHRELPGSAPSSWVRDESADLLELARTPMLCVCAGAKSILDLPATSSGSRRSASPWSATARTPAGLLRARHRAVRAAPRRHAGGAGRLCAAPPGARPPGGCASSSGRRRPTRRSPGALVDGARDDALARARATG
jgi:pseudouridine-5'-phosphate glycosidase